MRWRGLIGGILSLAAGCFVLLIAVLFHSSLEPETAR